MAYKWLAEAPVEYLLIRFHFSSIQHSKKKDILPLIARLQFHCRCRADVLFGIRCADRQKPCEYPMPRAVPSHRTPRTAILGQRTFPQPLRLAQRQGLRAWTSIDCSVAEHVDK
jgi:hypothetical protein